MRSLERMSAWLKQVRECIAEQDGPRLQFRRQPLRNATAERETRHARLPVEETVWAVCP
jgi:hypothetical protein